MQNAPLAQKIGVIVRRLRHDAGLSQEEFADRCGIHRTYVGAIERGEKAITVETTKRLCDVLGIDLSAFFTEVEKEKLPRRSRAVNKQRTRQ